MLSIAGQTAGPNELTFFVNTHGWPWGLTSQKNSKFFFLRTTPGPSACHISFIFLFNYKARDNTKKKSQFTM